MTMMVYTVHAHIYGRKYMAVHFCGRARMAATDLKPHYWLTHESATRASEAVEDDLRTRHYGARPTICVVYAKVRR